MGASEGSLAQAISIRVDMKTDALCRISSCRRKPASSRDLELTISRISRHRCDLSHHILTSLYHFSRKSTDLARMAETDSSVTRRELCASLKLEKLSVAVLTRYGAQSIRPYPREKSSIPATATLGPALLAARTYHPASLPVLLIQRPLS